MASVNLSIDVDEPPEIRVDDEKIARWITARLNDARNRFATNVMRSRKRRSGETYRRLSAGRRRRYITHVASAPGEYPALDTGRLMNSVNFDMRGPREGALYTDVDYAKYLTEGTQYMAARRMLADALNEVLEERPETDELAGAATVE